MFSAPTLKAMCEAYAREAYWLAVRWKTCASLELAPLGFSLTRKLSLRGWNWLNQWSALLGTMKTENSRFVASLYISNFVPS